MADKSVTQYEPVINDIHSISANYDAGELQQVMITVGVRDSDGKTKYETIEVAAADLDATNKTNLETLLTEALTESKSSLGFA